MSQDPTPKLTASETARVAWNVARMVKRCAVSEDIDRSDLERNVERILDRARKRQEKTQ